MRIFRPRTLQLYVLRQFLLALLLAGSACTLIMLLVTFIGFAREFEDYGVTPAQVALLTPYLLPYALSFALPLATMIAATITFGRLSAENEILAVQAGGASLVSLMIPLFVCGVLLSGFGLWCNQEGLVWGYSTIRNEIFKIGKPEFFKQLEKEGASITHKLDNGDVIHLNLLTHERDPKTGAVLKPIHLAYFRNEEIGQTLMAKDYTSDYDNGGDNSERILVLTLRNAQVLGDKPSFFDKVTLRIALPSPSSLINIGESRSSRGWMQNFADYDATSKTKGDRFRFLLRRVADFGANAVAGSPLDAAAIPLDGEAWHEARISWESIYATDCADDRARADWAEGWRKVATSFLPISMVLFGIGLGLLVKKSNRLIGFILGILVYFLLYYPMMLISQVFAGAQQPGVWAATLVFGPNIVIFALGLILCADYGRGGTASGRVFSVLKQLIPEERTLQFILSPYNFVRSFVLALAGRRTDGYLMGSFIATFTVVIIGIGILPVALDFISHGSEVILGVVDAPRPIPGSGIPVRTQIEAIYDVAKYYGICSLEIICLVLPVLLLISGLFCISALIRNREHLILKSSGVKLQRAFRPIWLAALLISLAFALIKEQAMPGLIMERSNLKPRIYHRLARATAVTIHTHDSKDRSVMFEMSQYDSKIQEGRNLRIYLLSEARNNRIPVIMADIARFQNGRWQLRMDPTLHQADPKEKEAKRLKPLPTDCGFLITPSDTAYAGENGHDESKPMYYLRSQVKDWPGTVTPSTIESERLGPGVLNSYELFMASFMHPEMNVELWRRSSEWVMGLLLLLMTIPLLVEEVHSLLYSVGYSILVALLYYGITMGVTEASRQHQWPAWCIAMPHVVCVFAGIWRFFIRMET